MKNTPFTAQHKALGAKMLEFAGYNMPISYTNITEEHLWVRKETGIFDVSHMGEFIIRGPKAFDLIQQLSSNDVAKLFIGKIQYSCLLNNEGGIVDDMLVYKLGEEAYMLVVNAANVAKDWAWITQHCPAEGVEMINISEKTALLAIQGPKSTQALQPLTDLPLADMTYYTFAKGTFAGVDNVLVSATGYTGSGGFEIYFDIKDGETIWNAIMESGAKVGLKPIGLAARDTLRLEKGFCLYGNDINDSTSPLEAGLGWITKLKADFKVKDKLVAQKKAGLTKKLVGFTLEGRRVPRKGYDIVDSEGTVIGQVTSGTFSPCLQQPIGMGYVAKEYAKKGSEVFIQIRKKALPATVTKFPFV